MLGRQSATRPSVEESFLRRAAAWASSLSIDDIPPPVRTAARAQRASTLGAAVWTTTHPAGATISEAARAQYHTGEVTFLGAVGGGAEDSTADADSGLDPAGAAAGNAALALALDFDDTILGGHLGHSAVFGALAYAESLEQSAQRALVAQVAANEIGARIASAAAIGPFRGQQTLYVHAIAGAVARCVLADETAQTTERALGLALTAPPWPLERPFFGGAGKFWLASDPLETGLAAVDRAKAGQTAPIDTVEGEAGFLSEFATLPLEAFLTGLGERWHTRAITVKAVPGCAYVTAPVEAALAITNEHDIAPANIDEIGVHGSLFATEVDERASPYLAGPDSPISALTFTVPYNVVAALVDGEHTPRQLAPERVGDDQLWDLVERTSVHHDETMTMAALESAVPVGAMMRQVGLPIVAYAVRTLGLWTTLSNLPTLARFVRKRPLPTDLSDADKRMGARVEVTCGTTTYMATVEHPRGFAGQPLNEIVDVAREKYRAGLEATGLDTETANATVAPWMNGTAMDALPALYPMGTHS